MSNEDKLSVFNYAAAFIDLLGQKEALKGFSLVPDKPDEATRSEFLSVIKKLHRCCKKTP
jgi:hypothetical protein